MTIHIFQQQNITPSAFTIDMRSFLDTPNPTTPGPHMLSFGHRTTVADAAAGMITMSCVYEDVNGFIQQIDSPGWSDLITTDPAAGSSWYMKDSLVEDKYYPLGNGPLSNPYGRFEMQFIFIGPAATSKFSYVARLNIDDGSASVQYHPAL